jgi:uncharacterized protein (DUF58 family)
LNATLFWILVSLMAALLAIGYLARSFPRPMLVAWAALPLLMSLALLAAPQVLPWLVMFNALLIVVAAIDLATLPRRSWFAVEREMTRTASLRKPHPVQLTVENRSHQPLAVELRDDVPAECRGDHELFALGLPPRSRARVSYLLHAQRRGAFRLEAAYLRVFSRLGLWQRDLDFALPRQLDVYPDMRQMEEYAILARTDRLRLVGLRRQRRIGQDNEFERLRDYTPDDNYKHIDWRSTARRRKLTVKDFQVNQSQRVIFLVDCGRMMTGTVEGISLLDHAFNAALMLSYVALAKGDAVGMICFADEIQRFVPPRGGKNQMNRLLRASFDRFATLVESRYDQAFVYLSARARKRSLVVLITNVIDEVNSHQVSRYLSSLVGRHLPLVVMLRDHAVFDAAAAPPSDDRSLYRAAAASEIIDWRRGVLRDLERSGVLAIDVFPEQMTAPLVNRYLEIKARHLL